MQALAGTALSLLGPSVESQGGSFLSTGDGSGYTPSLLQLRCQEGLPVDVVHSEYFPGPRPGGWRPSAVRQASEFPAWSNCKGWEGLGQGLGGRWVESTGCPQ